MLKLRDKKVEARDFADWLERLVVNQEKISSQLERLIICQEKRLSGQVINDFNSAEYVKQKGGA